MRSVMSGTEFMARVDPSVGIVLLKYAVLGPIVDYASIGLVARRSGSSMAGMKLVMAECLALDLQLLSTRTTLDQCKILSGALLHSKA
jgi:hypothetical protein